MMKTFLLLVLTSLSLHTMADSWIRVINDATFPVVAIWQASGCVDVARDPEGDMQFTVCKAVGLDPDGDESTYDFDSLQADRSVKIWRARSEKIGYCNSMDNETLTITGTNTDDQEVTGC